MDKREKVARAIAFAGRDRHDASKDEIEFWDHTSETEKARCDMRDDREPFDEGDSRVNLDKLRADLEAGGSSAQRKRGKK